MAEIIDASSLLSTKSELDVFSVPPTQVAIERSYWHAVYPKNTVTDTGPYEFQITPDPNYLDLSSNFIHLRLKLTDDTGAACAAAASVAPINAIGKTFFNHVKVWLGSKLCYDSADTYAYRAYLETLLNYGTDAKQTHLQSCLFAKDMGGQMDAVTNDGFIWRKNRSKQGSVLDLLAPIHADVFHQDRLMLNNIDVRVELHRNSDAFCIQTLEDAHVGCKLHVESMVWYVKKVEVLKSISLAQEAALTRTPALYPLRRMMVKVLHVEGGRLDTPHNLLFNGQLPRRLLIGCVDKTAYFGNAKKNPFNFKNFKIKSVQVQAGDEYYPRNAIPCDFTKGEYVHAYTGLMDTLSVTRADKGVDISYSDYKDGYCLFGFMLTPDTTDGDHWDLIRNGSTTIKINFAEATPVDGLNLIICAEFDNLLRIDSERNCFFDYSV